MEELLTSHMPYGYTAPVKLWYENTEEPAFQTIIENGIECLSLDDCLKRIISTQEFAVCSGGLHKLYLSYQKKHSSSGVRKFIPFKDVMVSYLSSMFFRSGSPLLESFNSIIYRMVAAGMVKHFWEDIKMREIGQKDDVNDNEDEDDDEDGPDAVVLTVTHLEGAFILVILGLACGVIVFLIELLSLLQIQKYQFRLLLNTYVREFNH